MKTLSGSASTAAGHALGEEPLIVIKVEWATGATWYADKDMTLHSASGRILNASSLSAQVRQAGLGSVGEMSFTLSDDDSHFRTQIDKNCPEGTPVTVYQCFESAKEESDLIILIKGIMVSPEWSEGDRTFRFSVETKVQDLEVGFEIEQDIFDDSTDTIPFLSDQAVGRAFPLCFGSNVHVPAMKLYAPPETALNQAFKTGDNSFFVDDASRFPETCEVNIDGIIFLVEVDKTLNKMTVLDANRPKYQNIPFAARGTDEDAVNPWVAWVSQDVPLANNFIYFTAENGNTDYHRIIKQEGRKIWLDSRKIQRNPALSTDFWMPNGFATVPQPIGPGTTIAEVAKLGRAGWGIEMSYQGGATASGNTGADIVIGGFRDTAQVIQDVHWKFTGGQQVQFWSGGGQNRNVKYVVNLIPASEIKAVYAWRRNPKSGIRSFRQVPTSYYAWSLGEALFGHTCATVTLSVPLSEYYGQGWEETIYVSHKSSVGPNVSTVLKWLLDTWSSVATDSTSFTAVAALCANYPVAIVLQQKANVVNLCEDVARKARCAILIEDGVARIKYLSKEPDVDYTIDEDTVERQTFTWTNTRIEEVVTSYRATWKQDYSGRPNKEHKLVKTENVDKFGLVRSEVDFNIYNVESLVQKSVTFWAHRLANAWRYAKVNVLKRTAFALEMLDCVGVNLALAPGSPKSVIQAHSFEADADDQTAFGLSLWLPWLAGTKVQDANAWMDDSGDSLPDDPVDNLSETDIDEQWADDLSQNYTNQRIQGYPAKIINKSLDGFGFNVDVYADGYEAQDGSDLPPTNRDGSGARIPFVAYPVELAWALDRTYAPGSVIDGVDVGGLEKYRKIIQAGTKISIFNAHGTRWLFQMPADQVHVPAKVNGPTPDALGRIGFTTYHDGFDGDAGETEVMAVYLGDVASAALGDKVLLFQHGDTKFAFPMGAGAQATWYKVISNDGAGSYTLHQYDVPNGTPSGSDIPTCQEANGATGVPADTFVIGYLGSNGTIYFDKPLGC